MRIRVSGLVATTLAATLGFVATTRAQAPATPSKAAAAPTSATAPKDAPKTPRTPWGDPDLQGTWDYRTITPLERAREFGTREFYTEEEKKQLEARAGRRMDGPPEEIRPGLTHAQYWTDPGRFISDGYRTSLIVDPPDGRIPALTADVDPRNAASLRLMERLGFRETHRAQRTWHIGDEYCDSVYFRLERPGGC